MEITYRALSSDEAERVGEIDRAEVIERVFRMRDGELVLEDLNVHVAGWPPADLPANKQRIRDCLGRGGIAWGAFDGQRLVGIAVLDARRMRPTRDTLDLYFLHVSNGYRDRGVGRKLVDLAKSRALEMGARRLYVSATPSEHSIRFYRGVGFSVTADVDPELFEREPEDIHMDMELARQA